MATTTSATVQRRLGLKVEIRSEAPRLKLGKYKWGKRDDLVEMQVYAVRFKFKNLEPVPFPSGHAHMRVVWTSGQIVFWIVGIPQLEPEQEEYATFANGLTEEKSEALSSGFGLFYCVEMHPSDTVLTSFDGVTSYDRKLSVQSVKVTTWSTIYAEYSMYISAVSLMIIALEAFVQFLSWACSVH